MADGRAGQAEVLFEFRQIGPQIRVAALDASSGIEVVIIAPLSASRVQMQSLALAKLKRRLQLETVAKS